MSARARLVLPQPMRAVRVHTRRTAEREGPSAKLIWLLNLRRHQEQQDAQREAVVACMSAVRAALGELPGQVGKRLDEVKTLAIELGLTVARAILGKALDAGHFDPATIVRTCLEAAVDGARKTALAIAMHPMDLALVLNQLETDPDLRDEADECAFHSDASLARGAVRVSTGTGLLLYDPREVLERVAQEIRKGACA